MTDDIGQRVTGEGLKMPAPKELLVNLMARAAYRANCSYEGSSAQQWESLDVCVRDRWKDIGRAVYGTIACNAGAQPKILKELDS